MNLKIIIPKNWQKDKFEVWLYKIELKLKKSRL